MWKRDWDLKKLKEKLKLKQNKKQKKQTKNQHKDLEISSNDGSGQPMTHQLDVDHTDTPDGGPFSLLNLPQSLEDIQKYLTNAWEGLSPPVIEKDIPGYCYAAIFENKQQTQLYVGKLTQWFLLGENVTVVQSIENEELKQKSGSGTNLEQTSVRNRSYGMHKLEDIIAEPLELIPRKSGYKMKLYPCFLRLYTVEAKLDRQRFL